MIGIYQNCSEADLHRYLAEFDSRDTRRTALKVSDSERPEDAIGGVVGKRLPHDYTGQGGYAYAESA